MQHRDEIILKKIISEIDVGCMLLGELSLDSFCKDEKTKRAVCMTVINIGELIKNVSEELRQQWPEIPWKAVAGLRDLTAHKYQTLRMEDVRNTVRDDFPALRIQLQQILDKRQTS